MPALRLLGSCDPQLGRRVGRVAREVLDYLEGHPNASDTMDGIMNWWLPRQRYETERRNVERALEVLAAKGLVTAHRLLDGTVLYARSVPPNSRDG